MLKPILDATIFFYSRVKTLLISPASFSFGVLYYKYMLYVQSSQIHILKKILVFPCSCLPLYTVGISLLESVPCQGKFEKPLVDLKLRAPSFPVGF